MFIVANKHNVLTRFFNPKKQITACFQLKKGQGIEGVESRPSAAGRGSRAAMDGNLLRVLIQHLQFHDRIQAINKCMHN